MARFGRSYLIWMHVAAASTVLGEEIQPDFASGEKADCRELDPTSSYTCPIFRYCPIEHYSFSTQIFLTKSLRYNSKRRWNNFSNPLEKSCFAGLTRSTKKHLIKAGYTEETHDCCLNHYNDFSWDNLEKQYPHALTALETLGFTDEKWDAKSGGIALYDDVYWDELSEEFQYAAHELCYTRETWDKVSLTKWSTTENIILPGQIFPDPSPSPTSAPTISTQPTISNSPTNKPSTSPSNSPTSIPTTSEPTKSPTKSPTKAPTKSPTKSPTSTPTTSEPTKSPTKSPTKAPTHSPTKFPTSAPTTSSPTKTPTKSPTKSPTEAPTKSPTKAPTKSPTKSPTKTPTNTIDVSVQSPTETPTKIPTETKTKPPTKKPTQSPTNKPTKSPTDTPSYLPTGPTPSPTEAPTPYTMPPAIAVPGSVPACRDLKPDFEYYCPVQRYCPWSTYPSFITDDFLNAKVGYTQFGWDFFLSSPIEQTHWGGLSEAARQGLRGFDYDEDKFDCCNLHYWEYGWEEFTAYYDDYEPVLKAFQMLGFTEDLWNNDGTPDYADFWWAELPVEVQDALYDGLCYTEETWNGFPIVMWPTDFDIPGSYDSSIYD